MPAFAAHTLPNFCRRYGIGRTKTYELINAGALKARRNGRVILIIESDAQAWLNSLPERTANVAA